MRTGGDGIIHDDLYTELPMVPDGNCEMSRDRTTTAETRHPFCSSLRIGMRAEYVGTDRRFVDYSEENYMLAEIFGMDGIVVLAVLAVLVFGGAAIPKLARNLGSAKNQFENGLAEGKKASTPDAVVLVPATVTTTNE